jgi:hypothetical protein
MERPLVSGGLKGRVIASVPSLPWGPRFESWTIRFAVDDEIVGFAGEAIDGTLRPHGIGKGGEPFVGPAIST